MSGYAGISGGCMVVNLKPPSRVELAVVPSLKVVNPKFPSCVVVLLKPVEYVVL